MVPGPRSLPNILYKRSAAGQFPRYVGGLFGARSQSKLPEMDTARVGYRTSCGTGRRNYQWITYSIRQRWQSSFPQQVYFGTEYHSQDLSRYAIPVEVLCGFFFIVIAIAFLGPGQELGRALKRWPNRVQAYTLNIIGGIVGILLFAACSWRAIRGLVVLLVACGLSYSVHLCKVRFSKKLFWAPLTVVLLILVFGCQPSRPAAEPRDLSAQQFWSPYRIDFNGLIFRSL
jgi:hypothetical protein